MVNFNVDSVVEAKIAFMKKEYSKYTKGEKSTFYQPGVSLMQLINNEAKCEILPNPPIVEKPVYANCIKSYHCSNCNGCKDGKCVCFRAGEACDEHCTCCLGCEVCVNQDALDVELRNWKKVDDEDDDDDKKDDKEEDDDYEEDGTEEDDEKYDNKETVDDEEDDEDDILFGGNSPSLISSSSPLPQFGSLNEYLTVATWNIKGFLTHLNRILLPRYNAIVEFIISRNVDVFLIQELLEKKCVENLIKILKNNNNKAKFEAFYAVSPSGIGYDSKTQLHLWEYGCIILKMSKEIEGVPIQVLESGSLPGDFRRKPFFVTVQYGQKIIQFLSVHIKSKGDLANNTIVCKELNTLATLCKSLIKHGREVIVGGDLNQSDFTKKNTLSPLCNMLASFKKITDGNFTNSAKVKQEYDYLFVQIGSKFTYESVVDYDANFIQPKKEGFDTIDAILSIRNSRYREKLLVSDHFPQLARVIF